MKTTLVAALLAALAAAPVSAKDLDVESLFNLKISAALGEMQAQAPIQDPMKVKRINAISRALMAMNDGVEIGGQVVEAIKTKGIGIDIRKQAAMSETVNGAIFISDAVSLYPRPLAAYIAKETGKSMTAGMPECSEKHYMALSIAVRAWIELGGDKTRLPVIEPLDGYSDPALAAEFKLWTENKSEMALYKVGQAKGTKDLMELESEVQAAMAKLKAGDPKRAELEKAYAELEAANKRFVAFLLAENDWRQMYP